MTVSWLSYWVDKHNKDTAVKWMVLASSYVALAAQGGFCISLSALFPAIMEEYGTTRARTAVVQSINLGVFMGAGIVSGWLVKRCGPLKTGLLGAILTTLGPAVSYFSTSIPFLVVTLGVVLGFGSSLMYISASTATESQFRGKSKLIVLSILSSATGVGGLIFPYLLPYLHDAYGLNWTFLLVGAICGNGVPCSFIWNKPEKHITAVDAKSVAKTEAGKHSFMYNDSDSYVDSVSVNVVDSICVTRSNEYTLPTEDEEKRGNKTIKTVEIIDDIGRATIMNNLNGAKCLNAEDKRDAGSTIESFKHLIKNKMFTIFTIALAVSMPAFNVVLIFFVDMFTDKGYTESDASLGMVLFNVFGILGKVCPGYIIQIPTFPDMGVPIVSSLLGIISILCISLQPYLILTLVSCAVIGLGDGASVAMFTVGASRFAGRDHLPTAMGMLFSSSGITTVLAGPMSGLMRDRTKSYGTPLYSAVGALSLCVALCLVVHAMQRREIDQRTRMKNSCVTNKTCSSHNNVNTCTRI